jgi:hypothetical protein
MYSRGEQLGDWKSTLKKVRDTVHKIFPRELSPSRMLEKVASDQKKKLAKRASTLLATSEKANADANVATSKRIAALQLQALPSVSALNPISMNADQPTFDAPATVKKAAEKDYTGFLLFGALALGGVLYVIRTRHGRGSRK